MYKPLEERQKQRLIFFKKKQAYESQKCLMLQNGDINFSKRFS